MIILLTILKTDLLFNITMCYHYHTDMQQFISLLPKEEQKQYVKACNKPGFHLTMETVNNSYDLITLAKKANEMREKIDHAHKFNKGWELFDGKYWNTKEVDEEGWTIRHYNPPLYPVRGGWMENMLDGLFECQARDIPGNVGFSQLIQLRKFRKILDPIADFNKDDGIIITERYKDNRTFIGLYLPCDFLCENWWMRLFYQMRALEHINEFKRRFVDHGWTERIAHTLYIYRFRYGLHLWKVAQKYVKKRFCGKSKSKKNRGKGKDYRLSITESISTCIVSSTKTSIPQKSVSENIKMDIGKKTVKEKVEENTDVVGDLNINEMVTTVQANNIGERKPMSISSMSSSDSDEEDKLERMANSQLFG